MFDQPLTAAEFCSVAGKLVSGDRAESYGDAEQNHANIAALWNAYLQCIRHRVDAGLTPRDVALMMVLLKIARTTFGKMTVDTYIDICGYGGITGELALREAKNAG